MSVHRLPERGALELPPAAAVDGLDRDALVAVATQAAAIHARAMARLAFGAVPFAPVAPADDDELLSYEQVAALLTATDPPPAADVQRPAAEYVSDLVRRGELPSVPLGKYRRIRRGDYRALVARRRVGALDGGVSTVLSHFHDRLRGAPASQAARLEADGTRRARRRPSDHSEPVGTRSRARARADREASAAARRDGPQG